MVHGSSVTTYANEPIILGRVNPWQPLVRGITSEVCDKLIYDPCRASKVAVLWSLLTFARKMVCQH